MADIRFSNVDKKTLDGQIPVRLCNYTDVYYNQRILDEMPFMDASATAEQVAAFTLRADDVLLTKDSETADDIGVSSLVTADLPGVLCGYHLAIVRSRPAAILGRYLRWALVSTPSRQQFEVAATGVTRFGLRQDSVAGLLVPVPTLDEQRAIADYLDAETARIDALVKRRLRIIGLLDQRTDQLASAALDRPDWPVVPLKWMTDVTVGIVIKPSELYAETGVPCLRGFNVLPAHVVDRDLAHITEEANEANSKSKLSAGDIVVVRTGNAGAAAVVPSWMDGGNCVDLLIVRRTPRLLPRFLETVLNSAVVRRQIEEQSVGALQAHFNTESLANLRLSAPCLEEQQAILDALDVAVDRANAMRDLQVRQVDLLIERRAALITAAVTGQLDIPGAAA